jgi:hypothetical protein
MRRLPGLRPSLAALGTATLATLVIAGVLIWFLPYLTVQRPVMTGVPASAAISAASEFAVSPHESACMQSVTIEANSHQIEFGVRPVTLGGAGGPPMEVILSAPGYRSVAHLVGGYPGGRAALAITPPANSVIGSACFLDVGKQKALLDGTSEARTMSRSPMVVGAQPVVGDIAITFTAAGTKSLLGQMGEVVEHASNLTDRLVPPWLIYVIAVLVLFGVPSSIVAAVYFALREQEGGSAAA